MKLTVNGESYDLEEGATLGELLSRLKADPERVAVMVNGNVVARAGAKELVLENGDTVEVLTFAAGG